MKVQFILSWVLRGLGALLVLVYFFGGAHLAEWFPGLEGMSLNPVFYTGIALYVVGAVFYRILFRKEQKAREQEHRAELAKSALKKHAENNEEEQHD